MDAAPGQPRESLVARAAALGPAFAARAERHDREASFPFDNWADLEEAGFLGLCVPERYGGLGADFATYALVSEELGGHCPATALTFNMHCATMLWTGQVADALDMTAAERTTHEARRAALYESVVQRGQVHGQPFSEGNAPGATAGILTSAAPEVGGYRVTGRKIFASLSGAADVMNVTCTMPGDDRTHFLGVPTDAEGVRFEGDWDPLGMRATVSRTLVLDGAFVPEENEFLPAGIYDQAATRWPHMFLSLAPTYLGLTRAVLDFTQAYLRGEAAGGPKTPRRDIPQKQDGWARMQISYEQARSLLHAAVAEAGVDPSPNARRRAWAAMYVTMDTAPQVAALAIRVCGGQSLLRPLPLERHYRDGRCGAVMLPWSAEICLDRLGRFGLYDD